MRKLSHAQRRTCTKAGSGEGAVEILPPLHIPGKGDLGRLSLSMLTFYHSSVCPYAFLSPDYTMYVRYLPTYDHLLRASVFMCTATDCL